MEKAQNTKLKIDWVTTLFLFLTPIIAAVGTFFYLRNNSWRWVDAALVIAFWALTALSITAGYHRYLSHRSYDANPWLKAFYLLFGAAAFQGSALKWCTDHRRHHRFVDTEKDPYNIKKGFWHAHIGWLLFETPLEYKDNFAPDLEKDRLIFSQHKYYVPISIAAGFGLPVLAGSFFGMPFGGLIFGGFVRIVLTHHCTFFINSLCHMIGNQPYSDSHSARDSFLMALMTFGEGYHNFHHEFQIDYRNGIRWYHWDPTKWFIRTWSLLGWTSRLKRAPQEAIIQAIVLQDEKSLLSQGIELGRASELKQKLLKAQEDLRKIRGDWVLFKKELKKNSYEKFLQLKADLTITKLEFQVAHAQWKVYVKTVRVSPALQRR